MNRETAIATLQGIRAAAESALSEGVACICIVLRRDNAPKGEHVLLYGHSGPRGELLQAMPEGTGTDHHWKVVARFRAAKLITCTTKTIETLLKAA
jgi:hypothetical protein